MNLPDEPDFPISPIVRLRMILPLRHATIRKVNSKVYQGWWRSLSSQADRPDVDKQAISCVESSVLPDEYRTKCIS